MDRKLKTGAPIRYTRATPPIPPPPSPPKPTTGLPHCHCLLKPRRQPDRAARPPPPAAGLERGAAGSACSRRGSTWASTGWTGRPATAPGSWTRLVDPRPRPPSFHGDAGSSGGAPRSCDSSAFRLADWRVGGGYRAGVPGSATRPVRRSNAHPPPPPIRSVKIRANRLGSRRGSGPGRQGSSTMATSSRRRQVRRRRARASEAALAQPTPGLSPALPSPP